MSDAGKPCADRPFADKLVVVTGAGSEADGAKAAAEAMFTR